VECRIACVDSYFDSSEKLSPFQASAWRHPGLVQAHPCCFHHASRGVFLRFVQEARADAAAAKLKAMVHVTPTVMRESKEQEVPHNWSEAFLFALAVAVGLTPEMLPMIVSVCLAKGALLMSRKKVIVKRRNSIQNLGAMDVLCTDKTGTLTMDRVFLEKHCDVVRQTSLSVLQFAFLNSHFHTGLKNVFDRAVLQRQEIHRDLSIADYSKVDGIPFDFSRKMMSVVVSTPMDRHRLICKGAPESVFNRCTQFELDGELYPMDQLLLEDLKEEYDRLSADGFRVLALAYSDSDPKPAYSKDDEHNLILKGYVAFLDPPKETVAPAITALQQHGIAVKVLTGDNELVSRKCPFQRMRWIQNKWPSRGHGLWGRSRGSFFLLDLAARFLITRRMQ